MKQNHVQNNKTSVAKNHYNVNNALLNYYLALMFTIFPVFFSNAYFNIRHDKYYLFVALSAILVVFEFILFYMNKMDAEKNNSELSQTVTQNQAWYQNLSVPDWAMIAFFVSSLISTIFSYHLSDALFGTAGRNNGLFLIIFYVAVYFIITRFYSYKEYVYIALAIGCVAVFILTILNYFYIDPLGMFEKLSDEETIKNFTSTIGNKNLLSSFICVTLPVLVTMSVHTENILYRTIYLISSALGFVSLMISDSDSGILGIAGFIVIFFIWYSRRINKLKKYFLAITSMLIGAKLFHLFSLIATDTFHAKTKGMADIQQTFIDSNLTYALLLISAFATGILYFIDYKKPDIVLSKAVPIAFGSLVGLCVIGGIGAMIYFSCIDTTKDLGSLSILRMNDKWGTHRGFMWIRSFEIFGDFTFFEKLFGVGPDNYYYPFVPYFEELRQYGDSSTNAAHNEYINYLITHGIIGLSAYLALVGSVIAKAIKKAKENPIMIVFVSAVICYSIQAVVNIAQPITTPLFIIFIALTEAAGLEGQKHNLQFKLI